MPQEVNLTLRTVDVDHRNAGVKVYATCKKEPASHMKEIACMDIMYSLGGESDDLLPDEHDIDVDINVNPTNRLIEIMSPGGFVKVSQDVFEEKLLNGMKEAEWFKSLKTGECHCEFLLRFE